MSDNTKRNKFIAAARCAVAILGVCDSGQWFYRDNKIWMSAALETAWLHVNIVDGDGNFLEHALCMRNSGSFMDIGDWERVYEHVIGLARRALEERV